MKQTTYVCNLCGTKEENTDSGGMIGIANYSLEYQIKDSEETKDHLCVKCLKKLTYLGNSFFDKVRPNYTIKKT